MSELSTPVALATAGIRDVVLFEIPDGEGYRKVEVRWLDALNNQHKAVVYGADARIMHGDIAAIQGARGEEGVADYVLGFIRRGAN